MKTLQDLNEYNKTMQRPLFIKIIEGFADDLAMEMINVTSYIDPDPIIEGLIQAYSHGNEWGEFDSDIHVTPIVNIDFYFWVKLHSTCKYKINGVDETEVGLNGKGDLEEVEDLEHEIEEIKFYFLGNEFDLTENKELRKQIISNIF